MEMNAAGYDLLKKFEGCQLKAYRDVAGVWTIGYGSTGPEIVPGLVWTQERADQALAANVSRTVDELLDLIEPELADNQFSALVCLAFNIGAHAFAGSSALDMINKGFLSLVPSKIKLRNKARINGVLHISRGLVRRRQAECDLWNTP